MKCLNCGCKVHYKPSDKYSTNKEEYSHHLSCCSLKCLNNLDKDKRNELYLSSIMKYYYELKQK